ncbi:MAG TPA: polysaccharide deacetylase family protein [Patescibacteria group bacterium]|nr:polysaccharide deacetylase family protein [Patescibacteria group bacterium]
MKARRPCPIVRTTRAPRPTKQEAHVMNRPFRPRIHRRSAVALMVALAVVLAACGARTTTVPSTGVPGPVASNPAPSPSTTAPTPAPATASPTTSPGRTPGQTTEPSATPTPRPSARPTPSVIPTSSPTPRATPRATPSPTPRPTPSPTPRPTPSPTATPRPSAPPSVLVTHGSRSRPEVALTLDMGGRVGDALAIMDWLVDHGVHASIFMTGAMAANSNTEAGRDVLRIVDAHPAQFTLGNHSYTHRDFRTLTAAEIRDELRRTEAAMAPSCDQDPRPFFRPPSGGYDADVLAAVGAAGYRKTVTWDIDTIDWRPIANDPPGPTADQIVAKVLGKAQNGSIVLMHLGGYETFKALPRIVAGLGDAGYELVTLDEMLGG